MRPWPNQHQFRALHVCSELFVNIEAQMSLTVVVVSSRVMLGLVCSKTGGNAPCFA